MVIIVVITCDWNSSSHCEFNVADVHYDGRLMVMTHSQETCTINLTV